MLRIIQRHKRVYAIPTKRIDWTNVAFWAVYVAAVVVVYLDVFVWRV